MRKFLKPFSFLPALILMYMIYSFSAQEGEASAAMSYQVSYTFVKVADKVLDAGLEEWEMQSLANRFHGVTRKLAHMAEYFALAITVAFPLYVYGLHGFLLMLLAGFICVGFACGDEYHQSFVAGREPAVRDILIDSFGVFWGIIVVRIIGWTGRKTIFRPVQKYSRFDDALYEDEPRRKEKRKQEYYNDPYEQNPQYDYSDQPYDRAPQCNYSDQPYDRAPQRGYYDRPYDRTPQRGYYDQPYNRAPQNGYFGYYEYSNHDVEEAHVSDKLAEDMSFKKLMHDMKAQRKDGKHKTHYYDDAQ